MVWGPEQQWWSVALHSRCTHTPTECEHTQNGTPPRAHALVHTHGQRYTSPRTHSCNKTCSCPKIMSLLVGSLARSVYSLTRHHHFYRKKGPSKHSRGFLAAMPFNGSSDTTADADAYLLQKSTACSSHPHCSAATSFTDHWIEVIAVKSAFFMRHAACAALFSS
jgi:hypothetical protein